MNSATDYQELLDYRRPVSGIYARVRGESPDAPADPAARPVRFHAAGEKHPGG